MAPVMSISDCNNQIDQDVITAIASYLFAKKKGRCKRNRNWGVQLLHQPSYQQRAFNFLVINRPKHLFLNNFHKFLHFFIHHFAKLHLECIDNIPIAKLFLCWCVVKDSFMLSVHHTQQRSRKIGSFITS